jgi:hypothetical protein
MGIHRLDLRAKRAVNTAGMRPATVVTGNPLHHHNNQTTIITTISIARLS